MKILQRFSPMVFAVLAMIFMPGVRYCEADQGYDDYLKEWSGKCDQYLAEWKTHPGKPDDDLSERLLEAAVRSDRTEVVDMLTAGTTNPASLEIKPPEKVRVFKAVILHNLGTPPTVPYNAPEIDCVFRRMTKDRFEAWTPVRGWLFDSDGRLVNEAHPPRRDGTGREWHGAFLPDGRWVTTDLWDYDRTLTFFSKSGKWVKEIPSELLAPPEPHDGNGHDIIGWCRCDRNGTGWVVSVGSEEGRALVFVKPQSNARSVKDDDAPWSLCYPRDVEPKGFYIDLSRPSDDFKDLINFTEAGHGTWVGYPHYQTTSGKIITVIAEGNHNFGYLPGTYDVFMCASEPQSGTAKWPEKTCFFSAKGVCRGWMQGSYLADDSKSKGIWLLDNENCVVALDTDLKPQSRTRFLIGGKQATPMKLFTDLRLGFFTLDDKIVLARW